MRIHNDFDRESLTGQFMELMCARAMRNGLGYDYANPIAYLQQADLMDDDLLLRVVSRLKDKEDS